MDRSPRLSAIVPLKIKVRTDTRTHFGHTLDISLSGAKIIMPLDLEPGCNVILEYKKNRARAEVIWSKPMNHGSRDHLIGLRLLDDGQRFWLVDITPKAQILESAGQADRENLPKKSGGVGAR